MLNLKKGLALVLAAATAFTFAPVSSLTAQAARTWDDDGLTTTTGIDSINNTKELTLAQSGKNSTATLQLAEHNNLSSTGKHVLGYKITVQKGRHTKFDENYKYVDAIKVAGDSTKSLTDQNGRHANTTVTSASNWLADDDYHNTTSYIVDSTDGYPAQKIMSGSELQTYTINGAWVKFSLTRNINNTKDSSFNVTVEALTDAKENAATADDKQTFTIKVQRNQWSFELGDVYRAKGTKRIYYKPDSTGTYSLPEGKDFTVTYRITNFHASTDLAAQLLDTNSFVAFDDADNATGKAINGRIETVSHSNDVVVASAHFTTSLKGSQHVYIKYQNEKYKTDKTKATTVYTLPLNITAGNGKLYVRYNTQQNGVQTYTDNYENSVDGTNGVWRHPSDADHSVENGAMTVGTRTANYEQQTVSGSAVMNSYIVGGTTYTGYVWDFASRAILPAAKTVYNADGNRTVQISASADETQDVTYSLVAPSSLYDSAIGTVSTTTNGTAKDKSYAFNPVNGKFDGSLDGVTKDARGTANDASMLLDVKSTSDSFVGISGLGNAGVGDTITFTTEAARKYGAVDKNGLVTLKSAIVNVPLYVVVTAKSQAQNNETGTVERDGSTYIIPVNITENQPLWVYAANASGYAEYYNPEISSSVTATAKNTLYLSKAKTSDTIKFSSNAGTDYMTARITDTEKKFSFDPSTNTISVNTANAKDGDNTDIVITTTSAPNVEGTAVVRIHVVYKPDWAADEQLVLPQDTIVRKGGNSSRKQIVATSKGSYTEVVFDRTALYMDDKDVPSGKREIRADEAGNGDVDVTSSGWVTYNKNAGSVYVRAYAIAPNKIPSGYTYALVKYGAATLKNDNTLTVSPKSLVLKPGETKTITATANTAITVNSADESVATVASAGSIVVKGVKQGQTVVTVTAVEDAANGIDSASYDIPVVVTDENGNSDAVTKPAKVTGLKVKNKKGAKVSVTWKAQNKSVLYRVYKKVGNGSWKAKNVTNAKATLDVKKGAKVTVKVKAFRRDANGKAVWQSGKATKAKAFKTDKK